MKIEEICSCKHCKKNFEWFYQVPQRLGSRLDVEAIPNGKVGLYQITKSIEKDGYKMPLEAIVYCPECGKLNDIKIEEKIT